MSCPGSGQVVMPTEVGELICPVCQTVVEAGWWDSALAEIPEEVPPHIAGRDRPGAEGQLLQAEFALRGNSN